MRMMPSTFELVRVSLAEYRTGSGGVGLETFVAVAAAGQCVESLQASADTDPTAGKLKTFKSTSIALGRMTKRTTQPPGESGFGGGAGLGGGQSPVPCPCCGPKTYWRSDCASLSRSSAQLPGSIPCVCCAADGVKAHEAATKVTASPIPTVSHFRTRLSK